VAPLFAATALISALLLFLVQPMIAKMVLPRLGGSPAVWNTCMVFFQAMLLAGYAYAHVVSRRRKGAMVHLAVVGASFVALPIAIPAAWAPTGSNPVGPLLLLLLVAVGAPFFVVSTSAPLLQRWFAQASGSDPYWLYAASNTGSLAALAGYPLVVEPLMRLSDQSRAWTLGYGVFAALVAACGVMAWRARPASAPAAAAPPVENRRRLRWIALAFVPSSLVLGVTTHVTTDIASAPLLWVVPLAIYLLTFILAFARRPPIPHRWVAAAQPPALLGLAVVFFFSVDHVVPMLLPLHVLALFVVAMACHGELARTRPAPERLTEFYLWLSVGGVLGGAFNALAAPLLFSTVAEYPIVVAAAAFLVPGPDDEPPRVRGLDLALPLAFGVGVFGLIRGLRALDAPLVVVVSAAVLGSMGAVAFVRRPVRFGLAVAAIMIAGALPSGETIFRGRSFFGVCRVRRNALGCNVLVHGTTIHGAQSVEPGREREPIAYYHGGTLVASVLRAYRVRVEQDPIAVVGLGAGGLSAYAQEGQRWTFYEIDPLVERIARDPACFTYLRDCPAAVDVVIGDARISLARAPDRTYGVIVLDAFGSDAVPTHLLTREALRLYLSKLAEDGLLAFHLSSRYLDLRPVLAALAADAGLPGIVGDAGEGRDPMEYGATWVVLARRPGDLEPLRDDRWRPLEPVRRRVWTDDYSNILDALR